MITPPFQPQALLEMALSSVSLALFLPLGPWRRIVRPFVSSKASKHFEHRRRGSHDRRPVSPLGRCVIVRDFGTIAHIGPLCTATAALPKPLLGCGRDAGTVNTTATVLLLLLRAVTSGTVPRSQLHYTTAPLPCRLPRKWPCEGTAASRSISRLEGNGRALVMGWRCCSGLDLPLHGSRGVSLPLPSCNVPRPNLPLMVQRTWYWTHNDHHAAAELRERLGGIDDLDASPILHHALCTSALALHITNTSLLRTIHCWACH